LWKYKPQYAVIDNVSDLEICAGENIEINVDVTGDFEAGNIFLVELSDEFGSFADAVEIGSAQSNFTGVISAQIPMDIVSGTEYKIRLISDSPQLVEQEYCSDLSLNSLPIVDFTGLDAIYCNNASTSVLAGDPEGGVFSGAGIIGNEFNPATAGVGSWEITYTYSDGNDCENYVIQTVQVNDCSGIETEISGDIQVYPNPNSGEFKITIPQSGNYKLSIYNSVGQIVWSESITDTDQKELSVYGLAPGAYVLQLINEIAADNIKILVK
jgi:hypothetical protein